MSDFGVTPQGFVRKGLQDILSEREAANLTAFGPGIVQTPQTPTGQLNGLWSDAEAEIWEVAEAMYRSFDPDQAEGVRLDELGRIRLIERVDGETDDSFAKAITNAGAANIRDADFYRTVRNLSGVTWARIVVNDLDVEVDGLGPHSVAVCALGGDDEAIAIVARQFIVPGVASDGNTAVETEVDGFCRTIRIHRPTKVSTKLDITVRKYNDRQGCPPPPNVTIAAAVLARFQGDERPANGRPITDHAIRLALAQFPSVELVSAQVKKGGAAYAPTPVAYAFDEIANFASGSVTVTVVDA